MFIASLGEACCNASTPVNYSLVNGDNIDNASTFLQSDGTPIDLTGWTAKMTIAFPTPVELTTGNGGLSIPTPINGQVFIVVSSTITSAWDTGTYPYDFWLIATQSPVSENQYYSGTVTVTPSVSPVP